MSNTRNPGGISARGFTYYVLLIIIIIWAKFVFNMLMFIFTFTDSIIRTVIISAILLIVGCYILSKAEVSRGVILSFPVVFLFIEPFVGCAMLSNDKLSCMFGTLTIESLYVYYLPVLIIVYLVCFLLRPRQSKSPMIRRR